MASSHTVEMNRVHSKSASPVTQSTESEQIINTRSTHLGDDLVNDSAEIQHMITDELPFSQKSPSMKVFHVFLLSASIFAPILLIGTFLWASFQTGPAFGCCSISVDIASRSTRPQVIAFTIASCCLSCFITICRQIQIQIKFLEYEESYYWFMMNKIALFLNITGQINIVLLVVFDTENFPILHLVFAIMVFVFCGLFGIFEAILSFRQRIVEYRRNVIKYENDKRAALKHTYFLDAILLTLLMVVSTTTIIIYGVTYLYYDFEIAEESGPPTEDILPNWVNMAEWIAFFTITATLIVLAFAFHYDNVDDELIKWMKMLRR